MEKSINSIKTALEAGRMVMDTLQSLEEFIGVQQAMTRYDVTMQDMLITGLKNAMDSLNEDCLTTIDKAVNELEGGAA